MKNLLALTKACNECMLANNCVKHVNADVGEATGHKSCANAATVGAAVAHGGPADWWLGAVDLLVRSSPSQGDNVADHIKEQLMERDRSACLSSPFPYDWNAGSRLCLMRAIIMTI